MPIIRTGRNWKCRVRKKAPASSALPACRCRSRKSWRAGSPPQRLGDQTAIPCCSIRPAMSGPQWARPTLCASRSSGRAAGRHDHLQFAALEHREIAPTRHTDAAGRCEPRHQCFANRGALQQVHHDAGCGLDAARGRSAQPGRWAAGFQRSADGSGQAGSAVIFTIGRLPRQTSFRIPGFGGRRFDPPSGEALPGGVGNRAATRCDQVSTGAQSQGGSGPV